MASITKSDYGEGSRFVFKTGKVPVELKQYNYKTTDIFKKTFKSVSNNKLGKIIERPSGSVSGLSLIHI